MIYSRAEAIRRHHAPFEDSVHATRRRSCEQSSNEWRLAHAVLHVLKGYCSYRLQAAPVPDVGRQPL